MQRETSTKQSVSTSEHWEQFRELMPVARKWSYFDHAAVAPIPQPALDAISKWATEATEDGDAVWMAWIRQHEECRKTAAQLINAQVSEIGLVPNTTFGINLVADGLDWKPGDNIVLPEHEFPSNVYPWMSLKERGVELRQVPLDGHSVNIDRIADACDHRTRIVSASWVGYASGARLNPKELATAVHEKGALFFLDAIQGMGVFPLDVVDADIDFLAADGHKWMLGPEGAGIFFLKHQHLDLLRPMNVGWNSVAQGNDYTKVNLDIRQAASRYEGGTQNMAGFIGLGASLQFLADFGLSARQSPIADRVIEVSDYLCQSLQDAGIVVHSERGLDVSTGIVLFEVPGQEPPEVRTRLLDNKVVISCRGGHVRAAVHAYNNADDVDCLVDTLKTMV